MSTTEFTNPDFPKSWWWFWNFWLTDKNGVTTQSEQGMISLMDPADGDYQLQIVPQSVNTRFIVAQFLANEQVLYKEYEFKGLVQEPKIVRFNSVHPKQDIIHDVREFKKPNFPKHWWWFWNFWNKYHK